MTGADNSIHIDVVFIDVDAANTCGATPVYLDIDDVAVVTVELFDLDVWAGTVERLAWWLKAADAATWADYASWCDEHSVGTDAALLVSVLATMAAQMRCLVETGRR
jgi:hypothetical protein